MNEWSERTLRLVLEQDYLDRLQEIYPQEEGERDVAQAILESIKQSFEKKDEKTLLEQLLRLEKFPYKDSYVGFLRKDRSSIERNPRTVRRICERLYALGLEGLSNGVTQPKEANTRRGNQFGDWVKSQFRMVGIDEFKRSQTGIVSLQATELESRNFCNTEMGVGISKRPDLVVKAGRHYVVGEAKFLSSTGGNQGRAFDDGIGLATNSTGNAYKVFILDGIHWIERGSEQHRRIKYGSAAIFSVLLLHDYLKNIPQ